ncbi:TusE/DsrC/DsvC family sulfur relay protein [Rhodoblastus sp.]|uniref:TusE/DsrC/DsvC family sulfur relay protein n=1 Tax=Rhodoblastus sp. TaxID=1962975 RepID=UPI002630D430|nr:TusE/DsrC/DsvC family sulfur relay protein [Rhodoblastus sp.]
MVQESFDINAITREDAKDPGFPDAPLTWTPQVAEAVAAEEKLTLTVEHWEVIRALQNYFARHPEGIVKLRELHDALDEKFHVVGGLKQLYRLFPGGPVAQGCKLAGLNAPPGASDPSFGSVA